MSMIQTTAGANYIATKLALGQPPVFNLIKLANPNPGVTTPPPPDPAKTVQTAVVWQGPPTSTGKIDPNAVAVSLMLGTNVGDFGITEAGLYADDGTLAYIATIPAYPKIKSPSGDANDFQYVFLVQFVGAATAMGVVTDATSREQSITALLASKANANNAALTGTPTAPTAPAGTNTTQLANTAFVRGEITSLVAAAPAALDTLNELALALGNDPNFATTVTNNLANKISVTEKAAAGGVGTLDGNAQALISQAAPGMRSWYVKNNITANLAYAPTLAQAGLHMLETTQAGGINVSLPAGASQGTMFDLYVEGVFAGSTITVYPSGTDTLRDDTDTLRAGIVMDKYWMARCVSNGLGEWKLIALVRESATDTPGGLAGVDGNGNIALNHPGVRGFLGLETTWNSGSSISIAAGMCRSESGNCTIKAGAFTKLFPATATGWTAGNGQNGKLVATASASWQTWHLFLLYNPTTRSVDYGYHTSIDPTADLPAGYTEYRRVTSVIINATPAIAQYTQRKNFTYLNFDINFAGSLNPMPAVPAARVFRTISVPNNITVSALLRCSMSTPAGGAAAVTSPLEPDASISYTSNIVVQINGQGVVAILNIVTSNQQIGIVGNYAVGISWVVVGWTDLSLY